MVEADAGHAEASLNAFLDDEASKLRILDYLRNWTRYLFSSLAIGRRCGVINADEIPHRWRAALPA